MIPVEPGYISPQTMKSKLEKYEGYCNNSSADGFDTIAGKIHNGDCRKIAA